MIKYILYVLIVALAAFAPKAKAEGLKLSKLKQYIQSVPNEIDKAEATDLAAEGKTVWKCSQQESDDLRAKLRNASETTTYTAGPISGVTKRGKVRKAVRNGETWYQCIVQVYDENRDALRNR